MHDFLLAKNGIAAPASHPLRLAVNRHKARLHAEFTKARLRRGHSSLESLRKGIDNGPKVHTTVHNDTVDGQKPYNGLSKSWAHPRWVRINTLQTNLEEQLQTTFSNYVVSDKIDEILESNSGSDNSRFLFIDKNIPNLLAIPSHSLIQKSLAYSNGLIILQDKASCFPAYLLNPFSEDGDVLDACAAPGNKTTQLAAILQNQSGLKLNSKILACERDLDRAAALQNMITKAGAQGLVTVRPGQDFLSIEPHDPMWNNVRYLLLDPSCSGSGMIREDEGPAVALPQYQSHGPLNHRSRKRKRSERKTPPAVEESRQGTTIENEDPNLRLKARLEALSTFQLKLLLHAFQFPKAQKLTYSTCSIYPEENEHVVIKALESSVAQASNWQILRRDEQISGVKAWAIRGDLASCQEALSRHDLYQAREIAEACVRCEKGTKEGTQGFFLAAFIRDTGQGQHASTMSVLNHPGSPHNLNVTAFEEGNNQTELEWGGFSDEEIDFHSG